MNEISIFDNDDVILLSELKDATKDLSHLKCGRAFSKLDSTNDFALLEIAATPSGTVIIANEQYAGRGRKMRYWLMQPGDIALSIVLKPPFLLKKPGHLPMVLGLAVIDALRVLNVNARLKWPNDIIIESSDNVARGYFAHFCKIGGILVENVFEGQDLQASVIGIGLNVTQNDELKKTVPYAASLNDNGAALKRREVLKALLLAVDMKIKMFNSKDFDETIFNAYINSCETLGRLVEVFVGDEKITGYATKLNRDGSIVIKDAQQEHTIFAGDVMFA